MHYRLLLVDDDPLGLAALTAGLQARGYVVDTATTGDEAVAKLKAAPSQYGLVILDYRMQGRDGAETAEALLAINQNIYVLIHSGDRSAAAIKRSWKAGAVGFIDKDDGLEVFFSAVRNWCRKYEETLLPVSLATSLGDQSESIAAIGLVGRSQAMASIAERVRRYALKAENVLILGETGTGKERIAQALHRGGSKGFFAVNCASFSDKTEMLEGELFGFRKGSFTGADHNHVGVFESAAGGTVFLDEVHTLDIKAQQKLLRVLQERMVRPVGCVQELKVSFRLLAAAKPDLEQLVLDGRFLPDLFERLNVLRIDIPPLRERFEDVEPLVAYFCRQYVEESKEKKTFLRRTVKYMQSYPWPRNVREFENTVRRLCVDTPGEQILPEHLDARFFERSDLEERPQSIRALHEEELKRQIERALASAPSKREAARRLGMPESSLRASMKRFGLESGSEGISQ